MPSGRLKQALNMVAMASAGDAEAAKALCAHLKMPFYDKLPTPRLPAGLFAGLDVGWARKNRLAPISAGDGHVLVATSNPGNYGPMDELALYLGMRVETAGAPEQEVLQALNLLFSESMDTADDVLKEMSESSEGYMIDNLEDVPDLIDSGDSAPVIRLVNRILLQAVTARVSDIHIEPGDAETKVRFRIDGMLYDRLNPPLNYLPYLSSRIKVMAQLDIAERRLPQDGRFQFSVAEKSVDVRVSVIPTARGERLVLRLLDKTTALLGLEELGMTGLELDRFLALISSPNGIILATGPTGSGKTTTLYAALSRLNSREVNIITIEDPVEYALRGVGQIQVNPKIGLSFAKGLRSVLRHDPDVIMIGEIRDLETAEIAIRSALTGHLVFSTLHTNDASSAITRLVDMGVEPFLVSSAVKGVLAQRLVRVLCPQCRKKTDDAHLDLTQTGLGPDALSGGTVFEAVGCPQCARTGYMGRTGLYELLVMDDDIRRTLAQTSASSEIRRSALKSGMKMLLENGLRKVREGRTSLEEVLRVASI